MIIHQADMFGLAELQQLRGRMARYNVQAFCYLLLPDDRPILPQARRRLKAIEEFSELGGGFKNAMRDLEIRGVGNLLRREQHGHIAAIGYDLYCRLLEKAVRRAKDKPSPEPLETHVELDVDAFVPEEYVPDLRARVEAYRRLTDCRTEEELAAAEREVEDRFGRPPEPVRNFFRALRIRIRAARWEFTSVARGRDGVVIQYRDRKKAEEFRRRDPASIRIVDGETVLVVGRDVADLLA